MTDTTDSPRNYFRQEENYIGEDRPIILVDEPTGNLGSGMDSVIDISDRQASPLGGRTAEPAAESAREIIISSPANDVNNPSDMIGDEWLSGADIITPEIKAVSDRAINHLRQAIRDRQQGHFTSGGMQIGRGQVTIEQVVRESVRPYLKTWVDHNLETIVKEVMQRELARLG